MKKSIFVLAALFAATFANAQITLELENVRFYIGSDVEAYYTPTGTIQTVVDMRHLIIGDYIMAMDAQGEEAHIYDKDLTLIKTFSMSQLGQYMFLSRNIFSTDGKWAWGRYAGPGKGEVVDEDGKVLLSLPYNGTRLQYILFKMGDSYKLAVQKEGQSDQFAPLFDIYSLPGNGTATGVSETSAPRHNGRKYLNNDQVLIDSNERTYTLQGQEVR